MKEILINSTSQFVSEILEIEKNFKDKLSFSERLYRGQSNKGYEIIPSLGRNRKNSSDTSLFNVERNLISLAQYKYPKIFRADFNPVELLALLQHYGIPTRLLDVTANPLVALYFSCSSENNKEKDGEVIVFNNTNDKIFNTPIANAIADTYRITRGATYSLENFFKAAYNQNYFVESRHIFDICDDKIDLEEWIQLCCEKPLFVYAATHSIREELQSGRFILFPNKIIDDYLGDKKAFDTIIEPIEKDNECIFQRFIIDKNFKDIILNELKCLGINASFVYGDNIDVGCKEIVETVKKTI